MILLQVLQLLGSLLTVMSQEWPNQRSCEPCSCPLQPNRYAKYVNCSRLQLKLIPSNLPKDLEVLDLSYNELETSALYSVCDFKFVTSLSISINTINYLNGSSFSKCSVLTKLNFTGSNVLHLKGGSFLGLDSIQEIYGLEAKSAEDGVFEHLTTLNTLDFSFHGNVIPENIFNGLQAEMLNINLYKETNLPLRLLQFGGKTLQLLHIYGKQVTSVPVDLLRGLTELRTVSLHLPELVNLPKRIFRPFGAVAGFDEAGTLREIVLKAMNSIPMHLLSNLESLIKLAIHDVHDIAVDGLFDDLVNLEILNLAGCNVVNIPSRWFAMLGNLNTLNVSSIALRALKEDSLCGLTNLKHLDMSSNGLRILPAKAFDPLRKAVKTLRFRSNILKNLDDGVLRNMFSLQYLDLSDNKLSAISPNAFADLKVLNNLQLQENKLHVLPDDLFRNQHKLQTLHLGTNHFTRIPVAVRSRPNYLLFLYLSNNKITTISLSLHNSLPYLKYISLHGNPIDCQCSIFSLRLFERTPFIDAFCESPPQYSRRHVMYIKIPEDCSGPTRNSGGTHQLPSNLFPSFLPKPEYDYYDGSDGNDYEDDVHPYNRKKSDSYKKKSDSYKEFEDSNPIGNGRSSNFGHISEASSSMLNMPPVSNIVSSGYISLTVGSYFNQLHSTPVELHGTFQTVNVKQVALTEPLSTTPIPYRIVTAPNALRPEFIASTVTSTKVEFELPTTPGHSSVSNAGSLLDPPNTPRVLPTLSLAFKGINGKPIRAYQKNVDDSKSSNSNVAPEMSLVALLVLAVPVILACFVVWWNGRSKEGISCDAP